MRLQDDCRHATASCTFANFKTKRTMPTASVILEQLTALANEWRVAAIAWHVVLGAGVFAFVFGWRPSQRLIGSLLTVPLLSVSLLAWSAGNAFNGVAFAGIALSLAAVSRGLPCQPVRVKPTCVALPGALLVAFAWVYPHFLVNRSWVEYLYASPLGVLPCPTLSGLVGVTLMLGSFGSRTFAATLAIPAFWYGVIGVWGLGVTIDAVLLAGALVIATVSISGSCNELSAHVAASRHLERHTI
jgi:hypothetical protein